MKNKAWEAIFTFFKNVNEYMLELEDQCFDEDEISEVDENEQGQNQNQDQDQEEKKITVDIVQIRENIRTQLDYLRVKLLETMSERDCYLLLFPIVSYYDEYIQVTLLSEMRTEWPMLQQELFQIDNAGEVFFETLDDLFRTPQTLPLVFEIYYFVLNNGFRGKYAEEQVTIDEYLKNIKKRINVKQVEFIQSNFDGELNVISLKSIILCYALAVGSIVIYFVILKLIYI